MKQTLRKLRQVRRKLRRKLRQRKEARQHRHPARVRRFTKQTKYLKHLRDRLRKRRDRIEDSHREGIDWAFGDIPVAALRANHKDFVCRYLSYDDSKNLSLNEAITYSSAGIDLVVVWESSGSGATGGYQQGMADANHALAQARALGKPTGAPIYFAVDFDAAGPEIESYFRGVASLLGPERAGIYAGLDAIEYIMDRRIVHWAWQTYAWSNHKWDKRVVLKQTLISLAGAELHISGVAVDYDKSVAVNFGQWRSEHA